jgi:hypothetical protein
MSPPICFTQIHLRTSWKIIEAEAGVLLFIVNLADYMEDDQTGSNRSLLFLPNRTNCFLSGRERL